MPTAYISIGSNYQPKYHIRAAFAALAAVPEWDLLATSQVYCSAAVDQTGKPSSSEQPYLNAVAAVTTRQSPAKIRQRLRVLEACLDRNRQTPHLVTVDLDLIAIDTQILDVDGHHLPDDAICRHAFVAVPFAEVAPEWVHPETGHALADLAAAMRYQLELEIFQR